MVDAFPLVEYIIRTKKQRGEVCTLIAAIPAGPFLSALFFFLNVSRRTSGGHPELVAFPFGSPLAVNFTVTPGPQLVVPSDTYFSSKLQRRRKDKSRPAVRKLKGL